MSRNDDDTRAIIRRRRFIATALGAVTIAALESACDGEVETNSEGSGGAQVCLSPPLGGQGGVGGLPMPCLGVSEGASAASAAVAASAAAVVQAARAPTTIAV